MIQAGDCSPKRWTDEKCELVMLGLCSTWTAHELQAYDFGGQDVYYAMHHLFLSEAWLPKECGRLQ